VQHDPAERCVQTSTREFILSENITGFNYPVKVLEVKVLILFVHGSITDQYTRENRVQIYRTLKEFLSVDRRLTMSHKSKSIRTKTLRTPTISGMRKFLSQSKSIVDQELPKPQDSLGCVRVLVLMLFALWL